MASSHRHNATGRSHQPSKAERQAMMNPNNQPKPEETKGTEPTEQQPPKAEESKPTEQQPPKAEAKKEEPKNTAPLKPIDPNKGAATRARWAACLKSRPGAKLVMTGDIKVLPPDSVITTLVQGNPKKRSSADRYNWSYPKGEKGYSTTLKAVVDVYEKKSKAGGLAYADIAWDVNHGFIQIEVAVSHPVDETKPEEVAEAAHEVERQEEESKGAEQEPEEKAA